MAKFISGHSAPKCAMFTVIVGIPYRCHCANLSFTRLTFLFLGLPEDHVHKK